MKRIVLSGIAIAALCANTALAQSTTDQTQPPATPSAADKSATQTITMSGCVANSTAGTQGFVLSNPIVLPSSGNASIGSPSSSATAGGSTASGATSASAFNGYRLTGNDMAQWAGKRVEITGTFVPSTTANTTVAASGASSSTLQEFRVVSVKPVGGACPQE